VTALKAAQKNEIVLKEASNLTQEDFEMEDLGVKLFFDVVPKGFRQASFFTEANTEQLINLLSTTHKEIADHGLRKAFNLIKNVRQSSNEAVILENQINETLETDVHAQLKAAKITKFLSKYVDGRNNREKLNIALNLINQSNLDEASEKIKEVYSSLNPIKNIKVAFTTVKNQIGESYQLCPKGIYIWGQPRPMAISNCRENCIDVRLNPDGTVGCNYLKWLNENLITQEQAMNLFDKVKSDHVTMNLEKNERTKFPISDQDPLDSFVKRTENTVDESWESQLEKSHKKQTEQPKKITAVTDKAIEMLLKDVRDVFDDDDLDVLEAEIRKVIKE
jgi:hypothetical protein